MGFRSGTRYAALALVFLSLALVFSATAQTVPTTGSGSSSTPFTYSSGWQGIGYYSGVPGYSSSTALLIASQIQYSSFAMTCIITGQVATPEDCIASSIPYMALGVLLSFLIIAIVYMVGNVMNFKPLKDWYRAELWESIKTMLLIGIIISALVIMSAMADMLVGANYITPLRGTQGALSTNLANLYNADNVYINQQLGLSYQAYAAMLGLSTGVGILKSAEFRLWIPVPIWIPLTPVVLGAFQFGSIESIYKSNFISATPGESAYSLTQSITGTVVIPMLILFQVQSSFFYDIMMLGLGILIPIGVIFRAFPLIRNIGGTLIATGIGIAIVYPSLLLLLNMPISNYVYAFTYSQSLSNGCPFNSGLICKGWNGMMAFLATANPLGAVSGMVTGSSVPGSIVGSGPLVDFPVQVALGTVATGNANVIGAMNQGLGVGLVTPLIMGIYPTLNFILANTLGMLLQFILVAVDLLVGLLITGAITQMLGGKVRLGIGNKLSISTGR